MNQQKEQKTQNAADATHAICERMHHFFHEQLPREQAITVNVEHADPQTDSEATVTTCNLHFHLPDGSHMSGFLTTENTGGNMYEVDAGVEGRRQRFSLSLPTPNLGAEGDFSKPICEAMLEMVKTIKGERDLREASAPSQSDSM